MVVSAQLIEQAKTLWANTTNLKHLLARAPAAGTQAKELGKAIKYGEAEFLFTNAILFSLGDLILVLCRPDAAGTIGDHTLQDPANAPHAEWHYYIKERHYPFSLPPWQNIGLYRTASFT